MSIKAERLIMLQGGFDEFALAKIKQAKVKKVYIPEGRPKLDASRMAVKELNKLGIKPVLISDNMAGFLFSRGLVREVWLSYQLVDEKGAVCRIGALILAVLAKKHKVPVYLFKSGVKLKFMGKPQDLFYFLGERIAPKGIKAYVPQVEWVPQRYISKRYE
jgi:methylthioribose-1-phosphate isomerase